MCKDVSTGMLGYLPELVNATSLMHAVLGEVSCMSKSIRIEAITVWRRYLELEVSAYDIPKTCLRHTQSMS
jgi:hypothetical protein